MITKRVLSAFLAVVITVMYGITCSAYGEIPLNFDSRADGVITSVKDQGETGACWAFSTISALEADAIKQGLTSANDTDFSEAHLVWFTYTRSADEADPLYGEGLYSSTPYDLGGNWSRAAGSLARWSGVANESEYPFDETALGNYDESARYDRSAGIILNNVEILTSANDVKEWIMEHGSCTASILWSKNYENIETSSYYYSGTVRSTNHMITIVGWDDEYPASAFLSKPKGDGAWLVKDSFGTEHHDGGYYHLSYYDKCLSAFAGYSVRASSDFDANYTYNGAGFSPCMSHSSGAVAANIFESSCNEYIKAVSFYTADPNTEATVKIYTGLDENTVDLTACDCAYETSQTFANQGYHTVDLAEPVALAANTRFAVAVTYSHSKGSVYIPVERLNYEANGTAYKYQNGQSVCLFTDKNKNWCDASEIGVGNFYIQAFTLREKSEITISGGGEEVGYRHPVTFTVDAKNVSGLEWHVSTGELTVSEDGCTVIADDDFEIYCTGTDAAGNTVESERITVNVKHGICDKIVYWLVRIIEVVIDIVKRFVSSF